MAIEVGNVFEGRVTGVKPFGAFVALPEGRVGMVHISEVSNEFVQDIAAVLHDGDTVKVQVINVAPDGKIALSIKRLLPPDTEFCTCTVKCEAGEVNENCPLCEKSLRNCTAPEAAKNDTETPEEKPKSSIGSLMILLVLALAGGGAALYYFKFRKPKADTTGHDDLDEYDFGEDEDADEEPAEIEIHSEDGQEDET